MEDARKLLDSLMGTNRNLSGKDAIKTKGENFKADNICKFYLLGFCPQYEQLFTSTKRDLGDCNKVHSDAMRQEFEEHAEHAKYRKRYEKEFLEYLEACVRDVDALVAREKKHVQRECADYQEKGGSKALEEVERLNKESAALLAEAETLAEAGDIAQSQQKVHLSEQAKKQAEEVSTRGCSPVKMDEVCPICGVRTEAGDSARMQAHLAGKKHLGYVRIRQALNDLREKMRAEERQSRSRERGKTGEAGEGRSRRGERDRAEKDGEEKAEREEKKEERGPKEERAPREEKEKGGRARSNERERNRGERGREDRDRGRELREKERGDRGGRDDRDRGRDDRERGREERGRRRSRSRSRRRR